MSNVSERQKHHLLIPDPIHSLANAQSTDEADAATAVLIDITTPGGAAIGDLTDQILRAIDVAQLTHHTYRAHFLAVLLWTARCLGPWRRLVDAGGSSANTLKSASNEARVALLIDCSVRHLQSTPPDPDPQERSIIYELTAFGVASPNTVLLPLQQAADEDSNELARACAVEALSVALARSDGKPCTDSVMWLESKVKTASPMTLLRIRNGLDWLQFMSLDIAAQPLLAAIWSSLPNGDPPLWPVEQI